MKKYNLIVIFILILITIGVSSYFYFLDIVYKDKVVKSSVDTLNEFKSIASNEIIKFADDYDLGLKNDEYNEIISELNIEAYSQIDGKSLKVVGVLNTAFSYVLMKKLLNIIKNDDVKIENVCIGTQCSEESYSFVVKFRPYALNFK